MATGTVTKIVDSAVPFKVSENEPKKAPDFAKTAGQDVGFTSPPKLEFSSKYDEREYVKGRLAGAYRIFGHYNLNEGAAGQSNLTLSRISD